MRAKYMTDATAAEQKPHGTENRFERVDVDQHRHNHCPANEDGNTVFQAVTPAPQPMTAPKDSQHNDARHKRGHIFESREESFDIVGICCVAITSMVIANANAASMKVSSRVIAMPRKRNPPSRGSASNSGGKPDVISCARSCICLRYYRNYQL